MQTILGSGGSIGSELARTLKHHSEKIRLVSRNPRKINEDDELFPADLTDATKVMQAIEGSEVAYLTAGLPYKASAWQTMWPVIMKNTILACKAHKTKLVFFDNIYLYDPSSLGHLTESSPVNPSSRKGKVRAEIFNMLMDEIDKGSLQALVARAPDFYGPGISNGVLNEAVVPPLKNGKKANWFCSDNKLHSFIWTPDAAKATAMLGNDEKAYGQVWHLPVAAAPLTGRQMIEAIAKEMKVRADYRVAGSTLVKVLGLFNPLMKEFSEMLYQYDRDYVFDSSKFLSHYKFKPTAYADGVRMMVENS